MKVNKAPATEYPLALSEEYETTVPTFTATFCKDETGRVHITFHINRKDGGALTAGNHTIAVLPEGFRPKKYTLVAGLAHDSSHAIPIQVTIRENGILAIIAYESLAQKSFAMGEITYLSAS